MSRPVPREQLPHVHLVAAPARKGTTEWLEWAKDQFLRLVEHGYNYSQAADYLGTSYKWWSVNSARDQEWAKKVRGVADSVTEMWEYPDLSDMTFAEFVHDYAGFDLAPHQVDIAAALEDPLGKLVLILGHPESGKSTLVSLWYVLYRLAQDPNIRIALVSKSSNRAQDLLTRCKRYLTEEHLYENSPRNLVEDFNGWRPLSGDMEWSQDQIYVRHRTSGERDPSIQALGIGKQIYGARLDLLILDDSLVLDNQITELQRDRIDNWFTNEARSRAQRGQTIVNGTRLFPHDLYSQWKKSWADHRLFRGVYIPAIQNEWTEQERPTWEDYWTLDGYDITEEIDGEIVPVGHQPGLRDIRAEIMARDPARWRMVYQQEDVEEVDSIFRQEHFDSAFELGAHRRMGQVFPHERLILGVDPATTGRAAALLIAVDPTTRVRTVVDIFVGDQLGAAGVRNKLMYQFWERYKDNRIGTTVIEENFAPTLLGDETLLERAQAYGTHIQKHRTVGRGNKRGNKWDEEYGIAALAPLFSGGLIAFANAGPDDRRALQALVDDMIVFPWAEGAQDALIALWIANGEANTAHIQTRPYEAQAVARGVPSVVTSRRQDMVRARR